MEERQKQIMVSDLTRRAIAKHAMPEVRARMDALNNKYYNFHFNEVKLKKQARLWGSTTHPGQKINLNLKLLFAPEPILEYVMAHELSHLEQHNHSPAFWALVARAVPDHKVRRRWLRENGGTLGVAIKELPIK